MIEVKGTDGSGMPQIIAFDGRILEIFAWIGGKIKSRRFHIDHLKNIELKERDNKAPILLIELNIPAAFGTYEFKDGGENLYQLVEMIEKSMGSIN